MPLQLEIITPERRAWSGTADSIVLPTVDGEVGLLPGHRPLVTLIAPGELVLQTGTKTEHLAVDRGFARISGDAVTVLTEGAIEVSAIDEVALAEAKARAEAALEAARKEGADPAEIEQAETVLRFAVAQQLIKGKKRG